tara:strand:- start:2428 stop:3675 length:1248 start_codon:yes stop_codon:yes gene_type:complete
MRAHPNVNFTIYQGKVYYNNKPHESGSFTQNILSMTSSIGGGISLYEYNIDRQKHSTLSLNLPITAFVYKGSAGASWKSIGATSYVNEFEVGDVLNKIYPLTASLSRQYTDPYASYRHDLVNTKVKPREITSQLGAPYYRNYYAIKNTLNKYRYLSEHYAIESNYGDGWNKNKQKINIIQIPSIFYGTKINPGTLSLKWYLTGSLIGELRDSKENGELIQYNGIDAFNSSDGLVAGVVLYNEGIIMLTASWALASDTTPQTPSMHTKPRWQSFGVGLPGDGISSGSISAAQHSRWVSASFNIDFQGVTETQTFTMFAKANRGQVNYSNNPTFLEYNQDYLFRTSSQVYEENPIRKIKNLASSSYPTHNKEFKRSVYVSRVTLYDENKNLIGVATLADPVRKEEDENYAFKLKLDI